MQFTLTATMLDGSTYQDLREVLNDIKAYLKEYRGRDEKLENGDCLEDDGTRGHVSTVSLKWEVTETSAAEEKEGHEKLTATAHSLGGFWVVDFDDRRYPFGTGRDGERGAQRTAARWSAGEESPAAYSWNPITWEPVPE